MRKLVQVENGEYENRRTHFVAVDAHAALRYLRDGRPEIEWELVDYVKTFPPSPNAPTPYRVWYIAPNGERHSEDAYDLSEIDFAE